MTWSPHDLRTVGFFAKRPGIRPGWLNAPQVERVCSVSNCSCTTTSPEDWIEHWAHNGLWLFDTLSAVNGVIPADQTSQFLRYGLRSLPVAFDDDKEEQLDLSEVHPEPIPESFIRLGYDLCSRSVGSTLECSPLSCNSMAAECKANRWCLLDTFEDALRTAVDFARVKPEPGPYLLLEVWANRLPSELPAAAGAP